MPPRALFTRSSLLLALAALATGLVVMVWWLVANTLPTLLVRAAVGLPTMAILAALYVWLGPLFDKRDRLSIAIVWLNFVGLVLGWLGVGLVVAGASYRWATTLVLAAVVAGVTYVLRENFE